MMSKNRQQRISSAATIVTVTLLVILAATAAQAAKVYTEKSLKGTYRFIVSEIRVQSPDLEYCSLHGVIEFNGAGFATIATSVRNCTRHPAGTTQVDVNDQGDFHYEVASNGEVLLIELDDMGNETTYVTHGQIVQKGNLLLFDNTASFPHHPDFLLTTAVAAKE
jgi:hypothetical protein